MRFGTTPACPFEGTKAQVETSASKSSGPSVPHIALQRERKERKGFRERREYLVIDVVGGKSACPRESQGNLHRSRIRSRSLIWVARL